MLEVVKYEIEKGVLTVGFKDVDHGFVVFSSLAYDPLKTKEELLQQAYIRAKPAIEYERTLTEHSITTVEKGEPFTPEPPKPSKIVVHCDDTVAFGPFDDEKTISLTAEVFDQYGVPFDSEVAWSSTHGIIADNMLLIPKVESYTEAIVTAQVGQAVGSAIVRVFPYQEPPIVDEVVDSEKIAFAEAIIDLDARLRALEGRN